MSPDWPRYCATGKRDKIFVHGRIWQVLVRVPQAKVSEAIPMDELQPVVAIARADLNKSIPLSSSIDVHSVHTPLCSATVQAHQPSPADSQ